MKTVTIEVDPKFLPDGYEAVAYRSLRQGEYVVIDDKPIQASYADVKSGTPWLVIRPVRQWHQVTEANILDVLKKWKDYDFRVWAPDGWRPITIVDAGGPPHVFMAQTGMFFGYWGTNPQGSGRNTVNVSQLEYSPKQ